MFIIPSSCDVFIILCNRPINKLKTRYYRISSYFLIFHSQASNRNFLFDQYYNNFVHLYESYFGEIRC